MTPDKLYYDGKCSLCAREMRHLRKLKDEELALVDIHTLTLEPGMPSKNELLAVLHLRRGDRWLTGVEASVAAWQHTRYGALWQWMRWPLIGGLIDALYLRWARWRFDRLYHGSCHKDDVCT